MRVVTDLAELQRARPAVLTMGAFDGVHRGHQYLIRQVVSRARRMDFDSAVITFNPRPEVILRPGSEQLSSPEQKERIIGALGVSTLAILPFSRELAAVPAGDFLALILEHIHLAEIWVGADFAFGFKRQGDVAFLIDQGARHNFAVHVVPRQPLDGLPISSTLIRQLVEDGNVTEAARFLGHFPSVSGPVVTGFGRGHDLGFPTANVRTVDHQCLPATGIYAGRARFHGEQHPAALSVGYNPVFGNEALSVEAYVLDWEGDLRGETVALDFVQRIREERNFDNVEALVQQMHEDVREIRSVLRDAREPGEIIFPG